MCAQASCCCTKTDLSSRNCLGLQSSTPAPSAKPIESAEEEELCEQVNDLMIIKDKFERYIHLGILKGAKPDNLDLDLYER